MSDLTFNEDEKDCLQELMNVAYGAATAAIADTIEAHATLSIPIIDIINASDLKQYLASNLTNNIYLIATQLLSGELSGENIFLIDRTSAISLAKEFDLVDEDFEEEDLYDIILEITNILSSSIISSLVNDMGTHASFSPPDINTITSIQDFNDGLIKEYNKVIIISTNIIFEEKNINAILIMLTTDESILYIKKVINEMLDDF